MDTDAVLALIKDVAAQVVTPRFRSLAAGDIDEKRPGDLVTVADREAEHRLTAALQRAYPDSTILGEEATLPDPGLIDRFRVADHAFTIDPVDGTKNFVSGSPDHALMVAELRSGEVVRGWIWQPQHELAYVAERGAGAWRNGERMTRAPAGPQPRGITSRRGWVGQVLGPLAPLELTWACCGVDYPRLAEGDADFVLYWRPSPWDHSPGSLLLTEAGGCLATADGERYQPALRQRGPLVAAADRATLDRVTALLRAAPHR